MNRFSTSLVIREMQIQTTIRYHFTSTKVTIILKTEKKCWRGYGNYIAKKMVNQGGASNIKEVIERLRNEALNSVCQVSPPSLWAWRQAEPLSGVEAFKWNWAKSSCFIKLPQTWSFVYRNIGRLSQLDYVADTVCWVHHVYVHTCNL